MAEKYGEIPPKFTKAWWSYFWMYYKWYVIGIAAVVIAVVGTAVQCAGREKYDLILNYCVTSMLDTEKEDALEQELEKYTADADGNGEVNVFLQQMNFGNTAGTEEMDYALQVKHDVELSNDYSFLFIYDKDDAEMMVQRDSSGSVYMDTREWLPEGMEDRAVISSTDGVPCAVSLAGSAVLEGLGIPSEDLYIAVRLNYSDEEYNAVSQNSAIEAARALLAE